MAKSIHKTDEIEKIRLSSADVCAIISACKGSGVSDLSFGDLRIRFGRQTKQEEDENSPRSDETSPSKPSETDISEIQDRIQQDSLERDEISTREEQLAQMWIENPAQAERLLLDGDLIEDDRDDGDDD